MKVLRRLLVLVLLAGLVGGGIAAYYQWFREEPGPPEFQGWVEAYLVFVSPDETGRIETMPVREGDQVQAGAVLFTLDDDLQKASVAENQAEVVNARQNYQRAKELLQKAVGSQKSYDDAESALRTAEARLNSAKTRLERRRVYSPAAGSIQEIYFRVGEMVQAGRSVVSLLPPENVRVRFFVPQATLPTIRIGEEVTVRCDGCADSLRARINFISAQAEFTPPIIYSLEERARLVFRVEAVPAQPDKLRVGQPAQVVLQAPATGTSHAERPEAEPKRSTKAEPKRSEAERRPASERRRRQ